MVLCVLGIFLDKVINVFVSYCIVMMMWVLRVNNGIEFVVNINIVKFKICGFWDKISFIEKVNSL